MLSEPRHFFRVFATCLTIFVILGAGAVRAADLKPTALYRRCYIHLTGESPALNDPKLAQVRSGAIDPIDACLELFDSATIDTNDAFGRLLNQSNPDSLKVLNNFYKLQLTFVKNKVPGVSNFLEDIASTDDVYDNTAVGLALTEALLNPQRNFSEIFTMPKAPTAKRVVDPSVIYPFTMRFVFGGTASQTEFVMSPRLRHGERYYSDAGSTMPVNPDLVPHAITTAANTYANQTVDPIDVGTLVGIHYNSAVRNLTSTGSTLQSVKTGFDMNAPIFPGVQYLRPYVLANAALPNGNQTKSDLSFMHRRFSQSILRDFLCRDLPVLRESDIASYMSADAQALPFRTATSCLRCHATIDQMAGSFRGIGYIVGGDRSPTLLRRFAAHPNFWDATKPASAAETTGSWKWPATLEPANDRNFHLRPARGRFLYRSTSGALISRDLAGPADVGPMLATLDDAYTCYARNMFRHFTGLKVELVDPGDPGQASRLQSMSAKDWAYMSFVQKLGKDLKEKQKPRVIIESILRSEIYRSADFQSGGSK
jgi:hypothetical protein